MESSSSCEILPQQFVPDEPIIDPYSSSNSENCPSSSELHEHMLEDKTDVNKDSSQVDSKDNIQYTKLKQIVNAFDISLLSLTNVPLNFEDTKCLKIDDVLNLLIPFLTSEPVTAKDVIKANFKLPDQSLFLRGLYHVGSYNFPEIYQGDDPLLLGSLDLYPKKEMDALLTTMNELEHKLEQQGDQCQQFDLVRDLFWDFFSFMREGQKLCGACSKKLTLPPRKTAIGELVCDVVSSEPDLVIGKFYDDPVIPVEIYNPSKYTEKPAQCSSSKERLLDEKETILKLFKGNLPDFIGIKQNSSHFYNHCKFLQQLLLQLLGAAKSYVDTKVTTRPLSQRRTFLGLFIKDFSVYISKLEALEVDILRQVGNPEKIRTGPFNVEFFPSPLNIKIPSHGAALLLFLRYYRRIYKPGVI